MIVSTQALWDDLPDQSHDKGPADYRFLISELRTYADRLNASNTLHTFGEALNTLEQPSAVTQTAHFFLLQLDPTARSSSVTGFRFGESARAANEYLKVERDIEAARSNAIAVLVSVDNVAALRRAYPNYFLDTRVFAGLLDEALGD